MRKKTLADRPERHEVTQYFIVDVLPYWVNEDRPGGTPFANAPPVTTGILPGAAGLWPAGGGTGYRRLKTSTTTVNPDTAGSQNVSEMPVR
jgi:hypothetical protein